MCKITKWAILGVQNYNSYSDIKKMLKLDFFLLISYIKNTGKNVKIEEEKTIVFLPD
jgi:hypothetical protein